MLKTVSLSLYEVMKSYDGREDIYAPNNVYGVSTTYLL